MADRIVVMRDGVIEQVGTPLELYDRPGNIFVAEFIGSPSMNFLAGAVRDGAFVTPDGIALPIPDTLPATTTTYGIRPEHLALSAEGVPAQVAVIEPTGSETHIIVRMGEHSLSVALRERVPLAPGDRVHLSPEIRQVHAFDQTGGRVN